MTTRPARETRGHSPTPVNSHRYARHVTLPGIGVAGQRALLGARVLCVGAGGLGSPVIQYLAAAGVGTLGIIDGDTVEESNLQRQVVHSMQAVGKAKVASAAQWVAGMNPDVTVDHYNLRLTDGNIVEIVSRYDIVVDATDNFATRYLISDHCADLGIPVVWGAVYRFEGQVSVFAEGYTLRDVYAEPPTEAQSCADAGVLGVLPGVIGTMMAGEVIKLITVVGEPLVGRIGIWDGARATFRTVRFERSEASESLRHTQPPELSCGVESPTSVRAVSVEQWQELVASGVTLIDVREPHEWRGGALGQPVFAPLSALRNDDFSSVAQLDRKHPIAVYCAAGARSRVAALLLEEAGFSDVTSLDGGITAWWMRD
ncbi:molybdopterin-synthase adenylyltransferase MoeB [Corynebacterium sp.]|uniref:molybdopterin-synthase adenylyltransferase MoeB n=1 Tax=Corynebacterium sp. TaxID=1720 RepID=UPI0026DD7F5E|nr:molybdopterin-synthase adenylyltransferase MoeB [Corynebacterium sp.]MDO5077272.1 molybdopterin-synthase adenylyltransferase MoeB [Corynebacterium sp.]